GLAIMLITHDLAVVKNVADYVALMRAGEIVETVDAASFFASPRHPYARQLLAAIPTFAKRGRALSAHTDGHADGNAPAAAPPGAQRTRQPAAPGDAPLLSVRNLSVAYASKQGWWQRGGSSISIVKDVSFDLRAGETLALLGESGCGKTTTAKALLRLLDKQA